MPDNTALADPVFSVVIVTWNAERFIRPCLESLAQQTLQSFDVILVDNGSTDNTVSFAQSVFEFKNEGRFRIINNSGNLGFCAANNQALKLCCSPYVLILNSDVVLEREFLAHVIACVRKAPSYVGMFNPTVLRSDAVTIDTLGLFLSWNRRFFNIESGRKYIPRVIGTMEIFGPCGAAAVVKREVLDDIVEGEDGYFDPRFFFLAEDFDMAWKARQAGWKSLYIPDPVCFHHGQCATFRNRFRTYLSFRNRYFLIIKHEGPRAIWRYLFRPYDIVRFFFLLVTMPGLTLKALEEIRQFRAQTISHGQRVKDHDSSAQ